MEYGPAAPGSPAASSFRRIFRNAMGLAAAVACACAPFQASAKPGEADAPKDSPELRQAFQLYDEFKHVEALPLLQKLAGENPRDAVIWERLGVSTLNYASTLPDPEQRKRTRVRAREILLKAKELGDDSNLLQVLLADIPKDGSEIRFSPRKDVDAAMNQAEADFSRGDMDKAVEGYKRALLLAPDLYEAALFAGDAYYKQQKPELAGEWFERAIKINPNRETAYRYWGDTLMREAKMGEARAKFIDAIVAEPYSQRASVGLKQWAQVNRVTLEPLDLPDRAGTGNEANAEAWAAYAATRTLWRKGKFKQEFPAESAYRHTAREEAEALHALAEALKAKAGEQAPALDAMLATLMRIDRAGLLEPYVYISRADKEIARDYPAFRDAHRDLARAYLDKFAVPLSINGR